MAVIPKYNPATPNQTWRDYVDLTLKAQPDLGTKVDAVLAFLPPMEGLNTLTAYPLILTAKALIIAAKTNDERLRVEVTAEMNDRLAIVPQYARYVAHMEQAIDVAMVKAGQRAL